MRQTKPFLCATCAVGALLWADPARAQYEDQSVSAFLAADLNGDEMLTREEFRVFIHGMAEYGAPMSRRIRTFGAYGMAFNRVDANDDGLATPDELRAADARERN